MTSRSDDFGRCFEGRRVLVTGHTGFKGSWMTWWLLQLGAEVTGISLEPDGPRSLYADVAWPSGLTSVTCDIRDADAVREHVHAARPEVVFHLAAQPIVRESFTDPIGTFATNVLGTAHVLDAARTAGTVRAVVNVTSDKCYENDERGFAMRETDPMGGHDPYSASKGCAELVASSYRRSFLQPAGIALGSARAGNVIGGGDWAADRLIPDAARAFLAREAMQVRSPHAVRPWQHVLEPLAGYMRLAQLLLTSDEPAKWADGWNFGPYARDAAPVGDVVQLATACWGDGASSNIATWAEAPHEATLLILDSTRAISRLGWVPALGLRDAVQMTMDWYRASGSDDFDAAAAMQQDIDQYRDAARSAGAAWCA